MSITAPIISSQEGKSYPNLELAQLIFRHDRLVKVASGDTNDILISQAAILSIVKEDNMSALYQSLADKYCWPIDNDALSAMEATNNKEMEALTAKYDDAIKNSGDLEILDITSNRGKNYSRMGEWQRALAEFDAIIVKDKTTAGRKIDAHFEKAKISLFNADIEAFKTILADASKLIESGGDWDRRNKLKFYHSIYAIMTRDIAKASVNLLDGIATFSSTEICSYESFMFYALITNLLTLDRNNLKSKIIDNAHVISVIIESPRLRDLVQSLYDCNYKEFMRCLVMLESDLQADRYFGPHTVYLLREFRILAFKQFLEAYKSIKLTSMALSFGVSSSLLDAELSHFIATGRLSAKIDKVGDIVEAMKRDKKNAQYQEIVKKGDLLLNQIQKLVRVIDQ